MTEWLTQMQGLINYLSGSKLFWGLTILAVGVAVGSCIPDVRGWFSRD